MNIGCHISIAKGIDKTPEQTARLFKKNCQKFGIKNVYIHTPYFINLASKNNRIYYGSINSIRKELERASLLGAKYVMTHLGSAKDLGEEKSLKKTTDALEKIFENYNGSTQLLIENSAGAGQIIGSNFKQIG